MAKILVTGLNPAWQKVLEFSSVEIGGLNRAVSVVELASGKGLNAAKVLKKLGHEVALLQIIGGPVGERHNREAEDLGIKTINLKTPVNTRTCTTLLDDGGATELIEPYSISAISKKEILNLVRGVACEALVICGSIPRGCPQSIYGDLIGEVPHELCLMDSTGGLEHEWVSHIHHLKINDREWTKVAKMVRSVLESKNNSLCISVTRGLDRAFQLTRDKGPVLYRIPTVDPVRNPIGAGDTATAIMTHHLLTGDSHESAFGRALAAASASCTTAIPAEYDEDLAESLFHGIRPELDLNFNPYHGIS